VYLVPFCGQIFIVKSRTRVVHVNSALLNLNRAGAVLERLAKLIGQSFGPYCHKCWSSVPNESPRTFCSLPQRQCTAR